MIHSSAAIIMGTWILGRASAEQWQPSHHALIKSLLPEFKAADPSLQSFCEGVMTGSSNSSAQNGQDAFVWHNFFAGLGRKGFYVESGANMPRMMSNTFFFDKCLGWSGLCIEPTAQYWGPLSKERSCTLVPECIADRERMVRMSRAGVNSRVGAKWMSHLVSCKPLEMMMQRTGRTVIDFWALDVEGFELVVLNSSDWHTRVNVRVILVEVDKIANQAAFDAMMLDRNFVKVVSMGADAVFVNRAALSSAPYRLVRPGPHVRPLEFQDLRSRKHTVDDPT